MRLRSWMPQRSAGKHTRAAWLWRHGVAYYLGRLESGTSFEVYSCPHPSSSCLAHISLTTRSRKLGSLSLLRSRSPGLASSPQDARGCLRLWLLCPRSPGCARGHVLEVLNIERSASAPWRIALPSHNCIKIVAISVNLCCRFAFLLPVTSCRHSESCARN